MLRIWFEQETETYHWFAHIESDRVFGQAKDIKAAIPVGTFITVPPELQPGITWYLERHCGFKRIIRLEEQDVLIKVD